MTQTEINKASKKADAALCRLQDLFYCNPTDAIVRKIERACDAIREVISEVESTQPTKVKK